MLRVDADSEKSLAERMLMVLLSIKIDAVLGPVFLEIEDVPVKGMGILRRRGDAEGGI
jgi:hypothetical protein